MASVAITVPTARPSRTARRLRLGDPPVIGRIEHDRLVLDLRCIDPDSDGALVGALQALGGQE
jgi:L-seryl-tRNA(Ser) seleniumtransferase